MGDYRVIADTDNKLIELFRKSMIPELIKNEDDIGVCSVNDRGDKNLGIFLYDIKESSHIRTSQMRNIGFKKQKYPSNYFSLFYMITAYSNGDIKFRATEEHRMLGKIMQLLKDTPVVEGEKSSIESNIEIIYPSIEEKNRIWNSPNTPYKLSVFIKVEPIEIESNKEIEVHRVMDIDMTIKEK